MLGELLRETKEALQHYSTSPELDARLIVANAMELYEESLITESQRVPTEKQRMMVQQQIKLRQQRMPMAYILGQWSFWTVDLKVNTSTLVPRPETERLVELILETYDDTSSLKVLELGVGSGAIALSLAKERPNWKITATDISAEALSVARENAENNGVAVEFLQGDWYEAVKGQRYDLIVSNPPYIAEGDLHLRELDHEPELALVSGKDGLDALNHIILNGPDYLVRGGRLFVEHGYNQQSQVIRIFEQAGFEPITAIADYASIPRGVYGALTR